MISLEQQQQQQRAARSKLIGNDNNCIKAISTCETSSIDVLTDVLSEVKYLTARLNRDIQTQQACSDWKFAAMVIDRLCLWIFSICTAVSTGVILLSAPHTL